MQFAAVMKTVGDLCCISQDGTFSHYTADRLFPCRDIFKLWRGEKPKNCFSLSRCRQEGLLHWCCLHLPIRESWTLGTRHLLNAQLKTHLYTHAHTHLTTSCLSVPFVAACRTPWTHRWCPQGTQASLTAPGKWNFPVQVTHLAAIICVLGRKGCDVTSESNSQVVFQASAQTAV